ncbi:MAG: extensin family protein [Polyangiaceae bacterium]
MVPPFVLGSSARRGALLASLLVLFGGSPHAEAAPTAPAKTSKTSPSKPKSKSAGGKVGSKKKAPSKGKKPKTKPRKQRKARTVESADWASAPSAKYAALSKDECFDALRSRKVGFDIEEPSSGVVAPVRIKGALNGVVFRTELDAADRPTTPYEVMDCRLALALFDFAVILGKHGIDEAHIFSAWRPPERDWPADKPAKRHNGGLAVDVRRFMRAGPSANQGKDLVVLRDWEPARDVPPCAADARANLTGDAKEIRDIFCEADAERLFTSMLSPNYDGAHANHFHLEVTPAVKWRLVL